jgi:beta-1,4-mannosyl-glycoprotein beta-1,4-N-acetylglucosaminyltransferase
MTYKIIDCFLFYNELELLKFKLKELNDIVDYFVLIESKYTFVGNEKELYYEKNKEMFSEYNDKIIHIIHDHNATLENGAREDGLPSAWNNEKEQRFYGTKGIAQLDLVDDDLIILSDLDEIVDKNTLIKIKEEGLKEPISCLEQDMYYYNLNNKLEEKWYRSKIVRYDKIKEYFDKSPNIFQTIVQPEYNPDGKHIGKYPIIKNGGWHLSFFGGVGMIKNKIKNFSHTELSHFGDESYDKINEKIQNNKDIFDREDIEFEFIHIEDNDYLPENYKMLL